MENLICFKIIREETKLRLRFQLHKPSTVLLTVLNCLGSAKFARNLVSVLKRARQ